MHHFCFLLLCDILFTFFFFFFNDTATTEIYTLSLHDALPISVRGKDDQFADKLTHVRDRSGRCCWLPSQAHRALAFSTDRKSTRLNSSHLVISYAVFCLKKKKKKNTKLEYTYTHHIR